jgi:hypothetical protein
MDGNKTKSLRYVLEVRTRLVIVKERAVSLTTGNILFYWVTMKSTVVMASLPREAPFFMSKVTGLPSPASILTLTKAVAPNPYYLLMSPEKCFKKILTISS